MKNSFVLSVLAALCRSAFSLEEGSYTIGSASLESSVVLTQGDGIGGPLEFLPRENGGFHQTWYFTLKGGNPRDFLIVDPAGNFVNCGDEAGTLCVSGSEEQIYTAELVGDNRYQLVAKTSGYFLRAVGQDLQLAAWDQSPNEEFVLESAEY
ncbi:unnamed protein product [Penicillium egyptiacum]|uniref:Ricin B lectin domain-containing protein n=1 Tax=Penicillium egyptiacum TaxID=1303716 RepID=A0A9W4K9N6_9EURO|nr:unnamed protein product [Penicillium egyptiacum]